MKHEDDGPPMAPDSDLERALSDPLYGDLELDPQDAEAAAHLDELEQILKIVDQAPLPSRPKEYGAQVWERLEPQLPAQDAGAAPGSKPRRWRHFGQLAAALILLALGFWAGRQKPADVPQLTTQTAAVEIDGEARERLLLAALGRHLGRTERLLTEISNTEISPAAHDESPEASIEGLSEQDWAEELLRTNRLYRQAAERSGQTRIVSLLNELEPILLELAHAPADDELRDLKRRVDEKSLLFKVRITEGRLVGRRSPTV